MQHHPLTGPANTVAAAKLSEKQAPTGKPMLVRHAIDSQAVLASVAADNAGASVLFVGTTRGLTSGVVTLSLEYEAHEMMASDCLAKLQAEALTRFELLGCAIVHRLGAVAVGAISDQCTASPQRIACRRVADGSHQTRSADLEVRAGSRRCASVGAPRKHAPIVSNDDR